MALALTSRAIGSSDDPPRFHSLLPSALRSESWRQVVETGAMAEEFTARRLSRAGLVAPCGMNCGLCGAYMRSRNSCPGCRVDDGRKPKTRVYCRIRNCTAKRGKFCTSCKSFPCERLSHLDERYRANYGMSMIENLQRLKSGGVRSFIKQEKAKWACPGCGATLCVHKESCLVCGRQWRHVPAR